MHNISNYFKDPTRCPFCNSKNIEGEEVETGGGEASQQMGCNDCGEEWVDGYRLVSITHESFVEMAAQPVNQELLEACIQARAALPDAWAAVQCNVPREVIELLNRAIEQAEKK